MAGLSGLAGCLKNRNSSGSESTSVEVSGKSVTLGGSLSMTGANAEVGEVYKDVYELTTRKINQEGGFETKDGETYKLELKIRDDEGDAGKSKSIYQQLVSDGGVDYLIGPFSSSITLPATAVAKNNGVPIVVGAASSARLYNQGNEWLFGVNPLNSTYTYGAIELASAKDSGDTKVGLLVKNDVFSQSVAKGAREKLSETDMDLLYDGVFPSDLADFSTALTKVKDKDLDVLLLCSHQRHAVLLANQLHTYQVDLDLAFAAEGAEGKAFKQATGENANYLYTQSTWIKTKNYDDPVYGSSDEFIDTYQSKYGDDPDQHAALAATVVETYVEAFRKAGVSNPKEVRDALANTDYESLYGHVSFDSKGVIQKDVALMQYQPDKDGDPVEKTVRPKDVSDAKPVYPTPSWDQR
ncbi:MAG: amino acid ABC transporter substrate-binding protein [Halobacteria archaeon]